jgi:hypothetical protein
MAISDQASGQFSANITQPDKSDFHDSVLL